MENEEKKEVEETTAPASEETKSEETTEETVEETSEEIDYKKEAEELESRLGKAEFTIQKVKEENKDLKEEVKETPTFTIEDVEKVVGDKLQSFHKETRKNEIENKIRSMTGSEAEAKLALLHYQNSIVVSGNDQEDIENAILLANKKKYSSILSEAMATARSKDTVVTNSAAPGQRKVAREETPTYTKEDEQVGKAFGLTPEQMKEGYVRTKPKQIIPGVNA